MPSTTIDIFLGWLWEFFHSLYIFVLCIQSKFGNGQNVCLFIYSHTINPVLPNMFIVVFGCYWVEEILIQSINSCVFQIPKEYNDLMVEGTWADWSQGTPQSFIM